MPISYVPITSLLCKIIKIINVTLLSSFRLYKFWKLKNNLVKYITVFTKIFEEYTKYFSENRKHDEKD